MATDRLLEQEYEAEDETSEPVLLESFTFNNQRHYRPKVISFSLIPISSGAIGKIQITFDLRARIDDSSAVWFDWKFGDVSEPATCLIYSHISAFRIVATGQMRLIVRGD